MIKEAVSVDTELNLDKSLPCQYSNDNCKNDVQWIADGHLNCETIHGIFLCDDHHTTQKAWDKSRGNKCVRCGFSPGLMFNDRRI